MIKLLVVDDDIDLCANLKTFFERHDYHVITAHDGLTAVEAIKKERPNLVFLDFGLPHLSGMDILKECKDFDDTIRFIMITGNEEPGLIDRVKAMGACDFVRKPFTLKYLNTEVLEKVKRQFAHDYRLEHERVQDIIKQFFTSLWHSLEAKDKYTAGHSSRMSFYSQLAAQKMIKDAAFNLTRKFLKQVEFATILHDIGKLGMPDRILKKAGVLTEKEREIAKKHANEGKKILEPLKAVEGMQEIVDAAVHHQERWDGKGYPGGLKGEQIPLMARLVCLADTFDAIVSDRPYRKGSPITMALDIIRKGKGTQFDPILADIFVEALAERAKDIEQMLEDHKALYPVENYDETPTPPEIKPY